MNTMWNDPTFQNGETDAMIELLKEKVPDIFEKKVRLDYEYDLTPDKWTDEYFTKLTYWFCENFAEERIKYIKEVGRVVHKANLEKDGEQDSDKKNTDMESRRKEKGFPNTRTILVAVALVVVILLLLKALID